MESAATVIAGEPIVFALCCNLDTSITWLLSYNPTPPITNASTVHGSRLYPTSCLPLSLYTPDPMQVGNCNVISGLTVTD